MIMASIKNLKRMCEYYVECDVCPLGNSRCHNVVSSLPDNADEIVDEWVQEHPIKTYAMDFFEKFPNAPRINDRLPRVCVVNIYKNAHVDKWCEKCECEECWNREMFEKV